MYICIQSLTENLNKKDSLIAEYSAKLTQAETELKQAINEKDQEIKVLIAEKTKLEHVCYVGNVLHWYFTFAYTYVFVYLFTYSTYFIFFMFHVLSLISEIVETKAAKEVDFITYEDF